MLRRHGRALAHADGPRPDWSLSEAARPGLFTHHQAQLEPPILAVDVHRRGAGVAPGALRMASSAIR